MAMKRVTVDGKTINKRTALMLACAEARLGYQLYITQGSYNTGGVSQSAGTHDGGGAIDVTGVNNWNEVVLALREVGFAAWHRTPAQGPWNDHIHAIAIGDSELSSGARSQVYSYYNRNNGLAYNGADDGPRLNPIPVWRINFPNVWSRVVISQFKSKNPVSKASVRRVQKALKGRGYYKFNIDGVFGPRTRTAFNVFLKNRNLEGSMSRKNLRVLCKGYNRVV